MLLGVGSHARPTHKTTSKANCSIQINDSLLSWQAHAKRRNPLGILFRINNLRILFSEFFFLKIEFGPKDSARGLAPKTQILELQSEEFELRLFGFLVEFLIRISAFGRPIPFFCAKNSKMFQRIRAKPEFLANFGILRWKKGIGRPSAEIRIKNSEFFFPKKEFGHCWS